MLAASRVVEKHYLNVVAVGAVYGRTVGTVARGGRVGVDVDQLAVALVAEHEAFLAGSVRAEVGRVIDVALFGLPGVERQIGWGGLDSHCLHEHIFEVLAHLLHAMS